MVDGSSIRRAKTNEMNPALATTGTDNNTRLKIGSRVTDPAAVFDDQQPQSH